MARRRCRHPHLLLLFLLLLAVQSVIHARGICRIRLKDDVGINEHLGPIVELGRLRAKYPQLGDDIHFSLLKDDHDVARYFRLEKKTGRLSSKMRIDRDHLCDDVSVCCSAVDACRFKLEVAINSRGATAPIFIKCLVHVIDANDNSPKFKRDKQEIVIKESTPVGNSVRLETAQDLDSQRNSVQNYDTVEPLPTPFRLEKVRSGTRVVGLMLRLDSKLNREKCKEYSFVLRAIDGGTPQRTGSMTVVVKVQDDNDNPPRFLNSTYRVRVKEGELPAGPILKLTAVDEDEGNNAITVFDFESSVPSAIKRIFSIRRRDGEVVLKVPLDYEKQKSYHFRVTASDKAGHLPSAVAEVKVDVIDLNDEKPKVTIKYVSGGSGDLSGQQVAYLTENAAPGQLIAYFSVQDRDTGANGVVNCSLARFKGADAFSLQLQQKDDSVASYVIKTTSSVDREKMPMVDLVVDCWDRGASPFHVKTRIPVRVLDVNDNTPKLSLEGKPSVLENLRVGTRVVRVKGIDPDAGANGSLVYSMVQSLPETRHLFRIDSRNGWLYTKIVIDRELSEPPLEKLPVVATVRDRGSPPRTGTLSFDVTISDVNDNPPKFLESPIHMSVRENLPAHHQVGEIRVTDRDSIGRLRVTIDKQFRQVPFIVHTVGNKFFLNTTKKLDRERTPSYNFNIVANDQSNSVTAKVEIIIEDENDNAPQIIFPRTQNKTFNLSWRESKGFQLMQINVKDPDNMNKEEGQHFFELHADNDILHVDPTTGSVLVQRPIKDTEIGQHLITVEVRDNGHPMRMSRVQFILQVDRSKPNYQPNESDGHATPTDQANRNLEGDIILIVVLVFVLILLVVIIVLLIYVRHWKQSTFDFLPDLFGLCCPYQNRKRAGNSRTPRQRQPEVENDKLTAASQNSAVERKLSNLAQDGAAGGGSSSDFYVTNGYEFHPGHPNFGKTAVKYQTIGCAEEAEALRAAVAGHEYHEIDQRTAAARDPEGRYYDVLVNGPHSATLGRNPHVYQTLYTGDTTRRDKRSKTTPDAADYATSPKQRRDGGKSNVPSSRSDSNVTSNLQRVCMPDMGGTQQASSDTSAEGFSPKHKTFSSYSMAIRGASPGEQVYTRSYPHVEASFV